jgi:hypothetical protein
LLNFALRTENLNFLPVGITQHLANCPTRTYTCGEGKVGRENVHILREKGMEEHGGLSLLPKGEMGHLLGEKGEVTEPGNFHAYISFKQLCVCCFCLCFLKAGSVNERCLQS